VTDKVPGERNSRGLWAAAIAAVIGTAYLNWITLWTVWTAKSEVPLRDQWPFLDDARAILAGHDVFSRLWACYWGHRPVVARLITLADVQWFSGGNAPLIALNLIFQTGHAVLLAYAAWMLFRRVSWPVFLLTAALVFHLSLSALQMENLMWGAQVGYVLVAGSATAAFLLLAIYAGRPGRASAPKTRGLKECMLLGGCIVAAFISTLSRPDGLLTWPVLVVQASVLRLRAGVRILFTLAGCLAIGAYFWKYEAGAPLGMGVGGAILHPFQSLPIVAMLVVEPISVVSARAGAWLGGVALIFAVYALVKVFRARPRPPAILSVFGAVALFSLATISTLVMGRISPEFIASRGNFPLFPSRYSTTAFFFWAGMLGISAWLVLQDRRTWPQFAVLGSMILTLTFGTALWQIGEAKNWRAYITELDVASTSLMLGLRDADLPDADRTMLEGIYPDVPLRSEVLSWLQRNSLSFFRERRARFMASSIPPEALTAGRCEGSVETPVLLKNGWLRVTGWIWDRPEKRPPRDLVFVNTSGIVIGLARSGLRRPDLLGKVASQYLDEAGWNGYTTDPGGGPIEVYGVLGEAERYCRIGVIPAVR
jgi:hypothetical protein